MRKFYLILLGLLLYCPAQAADVSMTNKIDGDVIIIELNITLDEEKGEILTITDELKSTNPAISCDSNFLAKDKQFKKSSKVTDFCFLNDKFQSARIILGTNFGPKITSIMPSRKGTEAGSYVIESPITKMILQEDGYATSKPLVTGNHHCSKNCKGEPTRTQYTIELTVSPEYIIKDPVLSCKSGGLCAYSSQRPAVLINNNKALGYFDVWTRPTTWALTARRFIKKKIETGEREFISEGVIKYGETFTVSATTDEKIIITATLNDTGQIVFSPEENLPKYFELISESTSGKTKEYTILMKEVI